MIREEEEEWWVSCLPWSSYGHSCQILLNVCFCSNLGRKSSGTITTKEIISKLYILVGVVLCVRIIPLSVMFFVSAMGRLRTALILHAVNQGYKESTVNIHANTSTIHTHYTNMCFISVIQLVVGSTFESPSIKSNTLHYRKER